MGYVHQDWHDEYESFKVYGPYNPRVGEVWECFDGGWVVIEIVSIHDEGDNRVRGMVLNSKNTDIGQESSFNICDPDCASMWVRVSALWVNCACGAPAIDNDYLCAGCRS